ncbi:MULTISPECIES: hypothetical protein [Streptomyces]|uniref:hypothetical protein n=1 Tax=Streptomyces TaxID=1883 RepID=UPI00224894B1|nr:hypothetical protein [Streptomyces sp. JHD 1]MCX2969254.1 hypothetical protein [Streptomyces sp. JHD 1]
MSGVDAVGGRRAARVGGARAAARLAAAAVAVAALAGCGIRATPVPVDAGPAPSRVACGVRETGAGAQERTVRIALVCSGRVVDVRRALELPTGESQTDRLALARTLLAEVRRTPDGRERAAGFSTAVPGDLRVSGPQERDDPEALRLSRPPAALPAFALAQLVCTYADTSLADSGDGVLLGGPAPRPDATDRADGTTGSEEAPVRRYECDVALRTSADGPASAERAPLAR